MSLYCSLLFNSILLSFQGLIKTPRSHPVGVKRPYCHSLRECSLPHLCKFAENFSDAWWLRRQNFPPNSHNLACWQARIATVRRNSKKLKRRKLTRYSDSQDKSIVNVLYKHQRNTRWAFARKHDIFTHEKVTVAMATWSAAW